LRFSVVAIGQETGALLLGPLAIEPNQAGQGCGRSLIEEGLKRAESAGHRLVVLVGDLAYYERFGFAVSPVGQISLPGPVDPARILVKELVPGALADYVGDVRCSD
jgi:predicted N-acetyltransferase YhbS